MFPIYLSKYSSCLPGLAGEGVDYIVKCKKYLILFLFHGNLY